MVVRSAANKASTLGQVIEQVSVEIASDKSRLAFLKKFAREEKPPPTTTGEAAGQSQPPSQRFEAAALARAEAALASHIGAVARILVKRAASKARDEADLYRLLAEEIEDRDARLAFIRKTRSVSGKL
jgi:serine/threonine-protein kinase